jgi:phosphoribosylaminoimidazole-succinocarboxamide synthase
LKKVIFEDGTKILSETDNDEEILCKFTDDLVDARGHVKGSIKNKAAINATIAVYIYKLLSSYHVPTHFKSVKSAKELTLKKVDVFPFRITVTNETTDDDRIVPAIQYQQITDGQFTDMSEKDIVSKELLSEDDMTDVRRMILKINVVLQNFFERRGLEFLGFWTQVGYANDKLVVCNEFTPDTLDIKEAGSRIKFTTTYLLSHIENADELYEQLHQRILS